MTPDATRREALLWVAASAGALALVRAAGAHAEEPSTPAGHDMGACIAECEKARRACVETARHCLEKGGPHANAAHVRLLLDCAEICQTTANFMLRGSAVHATVCGTCAEICERCAESCEAFPEDSTMATCAQTCRTCAKSCRAMSTM